MVGFGSGRHQAEAESREEATKMADDTIIDIDPSAFADEEKQKPLGVFSIETVKLREVYRSARMF